LRAKDQQTSQAANRENKPRSFLAPLIAVIGGCCARYYAKQEQHEINETALITWTRRTAYGTWAAACVAAGAAGLLIAQLSDARYATVLANRAWVIAGVPTLVIGAVTPSRMTLATQLEILNIGGGPGFAVNSRIEPFWLPVKFGSEGGRQSIDIATQTVQANDVCAKVPDDAASGTLWQKQPAATIYTHAAIEPPREFYQYKLIYAIHGCIKYRTFGESHFTRICKLLTPKPGRPISQWKFSFCPGARQDDAG
jgi:hypothetical protein